MPIIVKIEITTEAVAEPKLPQSSKNFFPKTIWIIEKAAKFTLEHYTITQEYGFFIIFNIGEKFIGKVLGLGILSTLIAHRKIT